MAEVMVVREIDVLIIDEHADVRTLLARRLSADPRFRVIAHTGSPLRGTELAWAWEPDIILIEPKSAARTGADAYLRIARASPRSRLVVFTSYLREGERRAYLEAGVAKCLLKGMSMKALAQELASLAEPALV